MLKLHKILQYPIILMDIIFRQHYLFRCKKSVNIELYVYRIDEITTDETSKRFEGRLF